MATVWDSKHYAGLKQHTTQPFLTRPRQSDNNPARSAVLRTNAHSAPGTVAGRDLLRADRAEQHPNWSGLIGRDQNWSGPA